jgi:probable addiction module antidote protein
MLERLHKDITKMKKIAFAFALFGLTAMANAADTLNGTVWQTIDEETKQPKAIVKFTEQQDGALTAVIQKSLVVGQENACTKCEGPYHNKSLKTEEDVVLYLNMVLEENDPAELAHALGVIAKARGMSQIAKEAGIGREALYKALRQDSAPRFDTINRVVNALGLKLTVQHGFVAQT